MPKTLSVGVTLPHHHPLGNPKPSWTDKLLPQKTKRGVGLIEIKALDHIIILPDGDYFSFADNGLHRSLGRPKALPPLKKIQSYLTIPANSINP